MKKRGFVVKNLVEECIEVYGVKNAKELSGIIGVQYGTLNKWENEGPSDLGKTLLTFAIENKKLKDAMRLIADAERVKQELIKDLKL